MVAYCIICKLSKGVRKEVSFHSAQHDCENEQITATSEAEKTGNIDTNSLPQPNHEDSESKSNKRLDNHDDEQIESHEQMSTSLMEIISDTDTENSDESNLCSPVYNCESNNEKKELRTNESLAPISSYKRPKKIRYIGDLRPEDFTLEDAYKAVRHFYESNRKKLKANYQTISRLNSKITNLFD
ncbi:PREDICTED: uncharacterized protein LOC106751552 isoform X2 [Dinoponera quadriceps]|uniref:Uncharacterized protein LOC106751552 isoform X2 n=1 Tax=Dinoponera quadriceps TaxID=609295 RepID=A0A6P3YAE2_DINQU|nr:PREDICTED: uncharacterized protein LOC106751552 isoform X2 [Dinoponera quadriceps]